MLKFDPPIWWKGATPSMSMETTLTKVAMTTETMLYVNAPQYVPFPRVFKGIEAISVEQCRVIDLLMMFYLSAHNL